MYFILAGKLYRQVLCCIRKRYPSTQTTRSRQTTTRCQLQQPLLLTPPPALIHTEVTLNPLHRSSSTGMTRKNDIPFIITTDQNVEAMSLRINRRSSQGPPSDLTDCASGVGQHHGLSEPHQTMQVESAAAVVTGHVTCDVTNVECNASEV